MASSDRRGLLSVAIVTLVVVGVAAVVRARRRGSPAATSLDTFLTKGSAMTDDKPNTPVLDLLAAMTADSLEATTLDAQTTMIARLAAMIAVGAPPASYLLNLGAASDVGLDADKVRGVLMAVAPIVGTPRVMAASGNIARALGLALDLMEMVEEEEEAESEST
jgi:hypothetical protein